MIVQVVFLGHEDQSKVISQIFGVELRVDLDVSTISVLMRVGLDLVLCVPLTTSNLNLLGIGLQIIDTMSSCKNDTRGNQRATTLVQIVGSTVVIGLVMENSAHVRPLGKLRLISLESLDPGTNTSSVTTTTSWLVHLLGWGRGDKIRILAAHIQEARTLAVLSVQGSESISDINKTGTVSDNSAIMALVVGHTLITKPISVLGTCFKISIDLNSSLVNGLTSIGSLVIVSRSFLLDNIDYNTNVII